jgi:translation initiation factor IF-3
MDFGKYKYELSKKDKVAKKKQHTFQMKEMRFRPKIDDHDFTFKTKHIREFLESGSKVKAMVLFRGREMAHIEFGRDLMERVIKELADVAAIDMPPKLEGNSLSAVLGPKPEVIRKVQASKAAAAKQAPKLEKKEEAELAAVEDEDQAEAENE